MSVAGSGVTLAGSCGGWKEEADLSHPLNEGGTVWLCWQTL